MKRVTQIIKQAMGASVRLYQARLGESAKWAEDLMLALEHYYEEDTAFVPR